MGKYSPKKKVGIVAGSIVALFLLAGITGNHQQPTANLNTTPASSAQASDESNPNVSSQPSDSTSTIDTSSGNTSAPTTSTDTTPTATDNPDTTNTGASDTNLSNDNTYTNVDGTTVHSPADSTDGTVPAGATAQCVDGTYSFSQHHSGTCSHHGGVATWL